MTWLLIVDPAAQANHGVFGAPVRLPATTCTAPGGCVPASPYVFHLDIEAAPTNYAIRGDYPDVLLSKGDPCISLGSPGAGCVDELLTQSPIGTFTAAPLPWVTADLCPQITRDAEFADLDIDNDVDIVAVSLDDQGTPTPIRRGWVQVLRNGGTGTYTDVTASSILSGFNNFRGNWTDVELADIDGNGLKDILLVQDVCGPFWTQVGAPPCPTPAAAFHPESFHVLLNGVSGNPPGVFAWVMPLSGCYPFLTSRAQDLEVCDLDEDMDLDVVIANAGSTQTSIPGSYLLENTGPGGGCPFQLVLRPFQMTPQRYINWTITDLSMDVECADVDGNGYADVYIANTPDIVTLPTPTTVGQDRLYLNMGGMVFAEGTFAQLIVESDPGQDAEFGDVNGDLRPDLLVINSPTYHIGGPPFCNVVPPVHRVAQTGMEMGRRPRTSDMTRSWARSWPDRCNRRAWWGGTSEPRNGRPSRM